MTSPRFNLEVLLRRIGDLPPLSQAVNKALELIRNPKSNLAEVANVLALDQSMASLILRWANSAYYSPLQPIKTVHQAVAYLGQNAVQSLILTASVAALMDRPVPGYRLDRGELWKHAVGVAGGARLAVQHLGPQVAEEAYHAGLLCDIGKLAFEVLLRTLDPFEGTWEQMPFDYLERHYFGVDHATLGGELARRWNLPSPLPEAIAFHHRPSLAGDGVVLAAAVHVADAAMMMFGIGLGCDGLQYQLDLRAFQILGLDEGFFEYMFPRVSALIEEAEHYIGLMRRG